ncbi:MAG: uroporphyrinogen-III synthase [Planctomycetota bacterium]
MRIVLTRPPGRGEAWRRRLVDAGHEVVCAPLTEIRDADPFPDPVGFDGVLFTSVAAVERAPGGRDWPRVGAVGNTTAAALRERGIGVDVVGAGGGRELAAAWGNAMGQRLLLPQARDAHPDLELALTRMGAEVDCVPVYETFPAAEIDRAALEAAEVVAFFAPSAVRAYKELGLSTRPRYWGLGATTRTVMDTVGLPHEPLASLDALL